MPLIMLSGLPSSGKTSRAQQLQRLLEKKAEESREHSAIKVIVINDETLGVQKEAYRISRTEKEARGSLMSAVRRNLAKDSVVIADSLNYIKGFRYQLYCEAKAVPTPSCVVRIGAPEHICKQWNAERQPELKYPEDVFDELVMRYEEPNAMTRWDAPLFAVLHSDSKLPVDSIWDALMHNTKVKPNQSTQVKASASSDFMYELDRSCQEIVDLILSHQTTGGVGGELKATSMPKTLHLPIEPSTLPQLQRLKRQFIGINKMQPSQLARIKENFIDFLHSQWSE